MDETEGKEEKPSGGDSQRQGQGPGGNRKRKSGFFAKAKKFGKQGKLGKGYKVDQETYTYFLRVLELCHKNEFENDEERDIFVENSLVQTENEEVNLSSNQLTSRVVENLISLVKEPEALIRFTTSFTPSLRTICKDPFASHVLEKLLEVISEKWTRNKTLVKWFRSTCKYILNNFEEFVFGNYANHVLRKACQCLSATVRLFSTEVQQSNAASKRIHIPSLEKFCQERQVTLAQDSEKSAKFRKKNIEILKLFANQFLAWPQFFDLFKEETTTGFIQCLILTLKVIQADEVTQAIVQVVKAIEPDINMDSKISLHTLEGCLSASYDDEASFQLIFEKYFKSKLSTFACHPNGHYAVESLCRYVPSKEIFQEMFEELEEHFPIIYESGYLSVFSTISEACKRLGAKQSNFINRLTELLENKSITGVKGKENLAEVIWCFGKKYNVVEGEATFKTELHGTLVLQHMLEFHKPFKIVGNLLEMNGSKLAKLAQDPKGSHVIDVFFKSSTVGEKSKENLLQSLKDHLVTMACSKFGARVLDNLWPLCSIKSKSLIASALTPRESQLNSNPFGKFLAQKCALALYKRDAKQWAEVIGKVKKRKNDVAELLTELGVESSELTTATKSKKRKVSSKAEEPSVE